MIDSHLHLNDEQLYPIRKDVVERAKQAGVTAFLVCGWDIESSIKAVSIANEFDGVYAAVGIHPENLEGLHDDYLETLAKLASDPKVIAIGEIGLDYHWFSEPSHRDLQKKIFIQQIDLANKLHLPCSIHVRDAYGDAYSILKEHPIEKSASLHCYSGSKEMMKEFLKLGYYIGFDGPITFKNAIEPKENVKECPLDRLLTETDSPYLAPVPYRGKINEPAHIKEITESICNLKDEKYSIVNSQIEENFKKLFHVEHYHE